MFVCGHDDHISATEASSKAPAVVEPSHMKLIGAHLLSYAQDLQLGRFENEKGSSNRQSSIRTHTLTRIH
jgi:hypothetical protein